MTDTRNQQFVEPRKHIYRKQAEQIIKQLQRKFIDGYYYETATEAVDKVCSMIPDNALIGLGGSMTLIQTGLIESLRSLEVRLLDRFREGVTVEEVDAMRIEGMHSDVYLMSTNAITLDGKLVNMDGMGNRVAALISGPKKVIIVAGMNKVVPAVTDAITRIKTIAAPINAVRVKRNTPCAVTGVCHDENCVPPNRICSQLVITESSAEKSRITVILIGEEYGF